jgi:TPR repeat protein
VVIGEELVMRASSDQLLREAESLYSSGSYDEAFPKYKVLADQGHTESQVLVGWFYQHGLGVQQSEEEAMKWFQRAANGGSAEAEFYMAKIFSKKGSYDGSLRYYLSAASKGYSPALFRLGWMHEIGRATAVDLEKAFSYYGQSAARGNIFGKKSLALLLIHGHRGLVGRVRGLLIFASALLNAVIIGIRDPYSEKLKD